MYAHPTGYTSPTKQRLPFRAHDATIAIQRPTQATLQLCNKYLDVSNHDGHALGVDCAQVGVLEEVNQEGLGGLRQAGSRQAGVERRRGGPEEETGEAKRQDGIKGRVRRMRMREHRRQEATFAKQKNRGEERRGGDEVGQLGNGKPIRCGE